MLLRPEGVVKPLLGTRSLTEGPPTRATTASILPYGPNPQPSVSSEKALSLCPAIQPPPRSLTVLARGQPQTTDAPQDGSKQLSANSHLCELEHKPPGMLHQPAPDFDELDLWISPGPVLPNC